MCISDLFGAAGLPAADDTARVLVPGFLVRTCSA